MFPRKWGKTKMRKNENAGFYLINLAKNTVKLTNFSVRVLIADVW